MKEPNLTLGLAERVLTAMSLLLLALLLAASGWLWRWDQLFYDLQMSQWSRPPADDIVIVAVDEKSLDELGRWPWSRDRHARLIDILTAAGAKAIALDILFNEADPHHPDADRQLIQSVAASSRVFLPVILEEYRWGGELVESMPIPALATVAAGLGHMHMELDADGIARGIFLYEGLGQAYWPHMMLSLQHGLDSDKWPIQPRRSPQVTDSHKINRHSYRLIPFSGPPGHYPRYSYSEVLKGHVSPDVFADRIVLVGVTATGLGDVLPTPVSAHGKPMPGVEINANILDLLRADGTITRVSEPVYYIMTGILVILPFFLYPYFSTRLVPVVTVMLSILLLGMTLLLMHGLRIWFPPAVALLGLLISYPLWSWRRLELTVAYLKLELGKLHQEQQVLPVPKQPADLLSAMDFLQELMPLQGWVLYDRQGRLLHGKGEQLEPTYQRLVVGGWWREGDELWTEIHNLDMVWRLGLRWPRTRVPRGCGLRLLDDFVAQFNRPREVESSSTLEQVERRILQVQQANARLAQLRRFIDTALGQMDDGLLVINSLGRVIFANPRAVQYIGRQGAGIPVGLDARELLKNLEIHGGLNWHEVLIRLLVDGQPVRFEAQGPQQVELYVQLQPLDRSAAGMHGLIINLSNIGTLKQTERTRARMLNFLSHDIRSPITSILSLTQSKLITEGSVETMVEKIRPLAVRSLKLADDFLQQARAEAADATSFSDTDFVSVIHNAMGDIYGQAHSRGIRLVSQLEVDEVWMQGNVALLERALTNLLENAIKFSPEEGTITVHLEQQGSRLECCVQDQGPGVPKAQQEQIFLPFKHGGYQGQTSRTGVGLGLSFVKVVAEKHNGRIELRDSTGPGATFCLILPCEPAEE